MGHPRDEERLTALERTLGLTAKIEDSRETRRLAAPVHGEDSRAILADPRLLDHLPALVRTLEGDPLVDEVRADLRATIGREF